MLSKFATFTPTILAVIFHLGTAQLIVPDIDTDPPVTGQALVFYFSDGTAYEYTDYAYGWNGLCNKLNSPSPGDATVDYVEYVPQASAPAGAFAAPAADPDSGRSEELELRKLVIYRDLHCAEEVVEKVEVREGVEGGGTSESVQVLTPVELDVENNAESGGDDPGRVFLNEQTLGVDAPASFRLVLGRKAREVPPLVENPTTENTAANEGQTDETPAEENDVEESTDEVQFAGDVIEDSNGNVVSGEVEVEEEKTIEEQPTETTPAEERQITPPPDNSMIEVVTVTAHTTITPSEAPTPESTAEIPPAEPIVIGVTTTESPPEEPTPTDVAQEQPTTTEVIQEPTPTSIETTAAEEPTPSVPGLTFQPDVDVCDPKQPDSNCRVDCDIEDPYCCHPTDKDYPDCCDPDDEGCWRHEFVVDKLDGDNTPSGTTSAENSTPAPEPAPLATESPPEPVATPEPTPAPEDTSTPPDQAAQDQAAQDQRPAETPTETNQENPPPPPPPPPESLDAPPAPAKRKRDLEEDEHHDHIIEPETEHHDHVIEPESELWRSDDSDDRAIPLSDIRWKRPEIGTSRKIRNLDDE
ncbi:hypothetical protein TWF694_002870 [Orbilia ellipsospora]|uniref:Uncharacterized protein n=1 Tax=Orbilia ellipsospora TaxID=2528407 RepID=A0AAV9X294_9PEZI